MSRLDVIKFEVENFEEIKREFDTDYQKIFILDGEYEWEHQLTGDKVKLINPIFVIQNTGIHIVKCLEYKDTIYSFMEYIYHANITKSNHPLYRNGVFVISNHFCTKNFNHIGVENFVRDFDVNIQTLKILLPMQNLDSAYQRPTQNVEMVRLDYSVSDVLYSKENLLRLVCGSSTVTASMLGGVKTSGYYYKLCTNSKYIHTEDLNLIKEYAVNKRLSRHYKVIKAEDLIPFIENFHFTYDVMCVGCGSSGSNFAWQLSKTVLANSYALVDKDMIDANNLRNTVYNNSEVHSAYKVYALQNIITRSLVTINRYADTYKCWLNELGGKFDVEFLFSGVDKLTVRRNLLNSTKIKSRYLLDAGYQGLTSSLYVIDREDEEQVNYYRQYLDNAIKNYVEDVLPDFSTFSRWQWQNEIKYRYGNRYPEFSKGKSFWQNHSDKWKRKVWEKVLVEDKEDILSKCFSNRRTCQSPNIIDIYTVTSGIMVSAVREIKNGKPKPFTHLEVDTSTGVPLTMIVRK